VDTVLTTSQTRRSLKTIGPDLGDRWPSRLVVAAEDERLSFSPIGFSSLSYLLLPKTCSTAFMTGPLKFFSSLQKLVTLLMFCSNVCKSSTRLLRLAL
jgi:hypothetical protein